jgi:hypothetical protein
MDIKCRTGLRDLRMIRIEIQDQELSGLKDFADCLARNPRHPLIRLIPDPVFNLFSPKVVFKPTKIEKGEKCTFETNHAFLQEHFCYPRL